jgi:hypothetical protein
MARIWTDNPAGIDTNVAAIGEPNLGTASNPFGTIYANEVVATTLVGDDVYAAYAAGTAYTLTNTSAAIDFGTTDPSITLTKAGTYLLLASATVQLVAASFAANQAVTIKARRTNNTPADVTNAVGALGTGVRVTITEGLGVIQLPAVLYTTTAITDVVTLFGDVAAAPSAGSIQVTAASIVAVRLY